MPGLLLSSDLRELVLEVEEVPPLFCPEAQPHILFQQKQFFFLNQKIQFFRGVIYCLYDLS